MVDKDEVMERLHEIGAIGIIRVDSAQTCLAVVEALVNGGLTAVEVTTTIPGATEVIRQVRSKYGGTIVLGMGTVLDKTTAAKGIKAGAEFLVSPSLEKEVIDACKEHNAVSCPGTFTATEIAHAWKWGADLIKVFPASVVGPAYIKAILAPLPWVKLVPTGGVDVHNVSDFMKAGSFCVGVGGALVSSKAIAEGRFELLTSAAEELVSAIKGARAP